MYCIHCGKDLESKANPYCRHSYPYRLRTLFITFPKGLPGGIPEVETPQAGRAAPSTVTSENFSGNSDVKEALHES